LCTVDAEKSTVLTPQNAALFVAAPLVAKAHAVVGAWYFEAKALDGTGGLFTNAICADKTICAFSTGTTATIIAAFHPVT